MSADVEVAVIGGGPAGAAAAVACARAGVRVGLFEGVAIGGEALDLEEIGELPGQGTVSGADFCVALTEEVLAHPVDLRLGETVTGIGREGSSWRIDADVGTVRAAALIVCTGSERLALPARPEGDADPLFGRGIFTCASCDAPLYAGKRVAVAGGGDTGVGAALTLSRYAAEVVLFERERELTAQAALAQALAGVPNVRVRCGAEVTEAIGESALEAIVVASGGATVTERVDGLLLAVGLRPCSDLVAHLMDLDDTGAIRVGPDLATSAGRAFAAGDVRKGAAHRFAAALDDGLTAATGALAVLAQSPGRG